MRRALSVVSLLAIVAVGGCSDGEMSMADYVDRFNDIVGDAAQEYDEFSASPEGMVLIAEREQLSDFTPQDLQAGLERIGRIENSVLEAAASIEPPEQVAEFHAFYFAESPFTAAREALAVRAGSAADWEELSATPEMEAYRIAIAEDKRICDEFAASVDSTSDDVSFGDMPWIPSELAETVESVRGCAQYPEDPANIFRPVSGSP